LHAASTADDALAFQLPRTGAARVGATVVIAITLGMSSGGGEQSTPNWRFGVRGRRILRCAEVPVY